MVLGAVKMKKGTTQLIDFTVRSDERGSLIALESLSDQVPFDIKRVYYSFGTTPNAVRGKHAHYNLKEILICTSGSCDVDIFDGVVRKNYHLDTPTKGLFIDGFIWREMKNFTSDCVLMVLASDHYDETDYIRDYNEFLYFLSNH